MCVREEATWQCQLASCTSNRHFTRLEETLWVSQGLYLENREVTGKESLVVSTTWREYRESCLTSHWFPLPWDPRREISRNLSLSSEESGVWRQNKTQWQQIVLKVNSLRRRAYKILCTYLPPVSLLLSPSFSLYRVLSVPMLLWGYDGWRNYKGKIKGKKGGRICSIHCERKLNKTKKGRRDAEWRPEFWLP